MWGASRVGVWSRGFFKGEALVPNSEELRKWPLDLADFVCSRILALGSLVGETLSSSTIVWTNVGFPVLGRDLVLFGV